MPAACLIPSWLIRAILAFSALAGIAKGDPTFSEKAADYYVSSLPDLATDAYFPTMHAGNILIDADTQSSLFFWHVAARFQVSEPRTVIWLNGGPGCSSMDGALMEIGPFRLENASHLVENDGAWTEFENVLFVDQPVGVGYSRTDGEYDHELDTAAEHMLVFLQNWLAIFPEARDHAIYLAGESYAGQYIPYIYDAIRAHNLKASPEDRIDIAGLILGNPWIDPPHQYLSYVPFLKEHGLIKDEKSRLELEGLHQQCANELASKAVILPDNSLCNRITSVAYQTFDSGKSCFNGYDIRLSDSFPACGMNWPEGVEYLSTYLSREDVRKALNTYTEEFNWQECSSKVSGRFGAVKNPAANTLLPSILDEVPVLLMIGDQDYLCNGQGLDDMVRNTQWGGEVMAGFVDGELLEDLLFDDAVIGSLQQGRNLTVAHVTNGSHMLPSDMQYQSRMLLHGFTGLTDGFSAIVRPDPTKASPGSPAQTTGPSEEERQQMVNDAMTKAYYQAGFVALAFVLVGLLVFAIFWWRNRSDSTLSFRAIGNALLHFSNRRRRPDRGNYVNLQTFRRSERPATIIEEDEPEEV